MMVTATGNLIQTTSREIDELDSLTVYVRAASDVVPNLRIRRSSPMRDAIGFSVAGAGTTVAVARESELEGLEGCAMTHAVVRDFAPGAGVNGGE